MKAFIAAIILLALLIGAAFFTSNALTRAADDLLNQTEELTKAPDNKRAAAGTKMEQLWQERRFAFSMAINQNELDLLESTFARLKASATTEDGDDYLIAVSELTNALSHIRDLCTISFDNIL